MATIDNEFGKGISLSTGFDLGAQKPLDSRIAVNTIAERDAHVTNNRAYEGMHVYVAETKRNYQLKDVNGELTWVDMEDELQDQLDEIKEALGLDGESSTSGDSLLDRVDTAEADIDALEALVGKAAVAGEGEEAGTPATGLHLALDEEKAAREAADQGLQGEIDALEQLVGTIPTKEVDGAQVAVHDSIVDMIQDLTAAEQARAEKVEQGLQGEIDALEQLVGTKDDAKEVETVYGAIAAEKARAEKAEQDLDARLDTLEGNEDTPGSVAKALKDAKAYTDEVAGSYSAEGVEASGLRGEIEAKHQAADKALDGEATARKAADQALAEMLGATIADGVVTKADIPAVAAAGKDQPSTIIGAIGALDGRLDTLEGDENKTGSVAKAVADAKAALLGDAAEGFNTLGKLEDAIQAEVARVGDVKDVIIKEEVKDKDGNVVSEAVIAKSSTVIEYVDNKITGLINTAPEAMNTLGELAKAIDAHQDVYEAYVAQQSAKIGDLTQTGVTGDNVAAQLKQLDADVKAEAGRAAGEEGAIRGEMATEAARVNKKIADDIAAESALRVAEEGAIRQELADAVGTASAEGVDATGLHKVIEDADKALQDAIVAHETAVNVAIGTVPTGVEDEKEGADNSLKALIQRAVAKAAKETSDLQSDMASTVASLKAEIKDGELALNLVEGKGESQVVTPIAKTTVPTMTNEEEAAAIAAIIAPPVQEPEQPAE